MLIEPPDDIWTNRQQCLLFLGLLQVQGRNIVISVTYDGRDIIRIYMEVSPLLLFSFHDEKGDYTQHK